ncbi:hypothetical protein RJ640_029873, partial [Escallonia rubra]
ESQKGQTVKGLHQFKLYLKKFGYLNYDPSNKNSRADDDEFDELLESALKQYQANYHLKATGKLDSATIKEMMLPRCGVADVVKGKNSIPTHKKRKLGIHTVSHYTFPNGMPKWDASKRSLTYRFKSAVEVVGLDDLRSACASAFKRWQDVSVFTFEEAPEGSAEADIEIGFYRGDHGDGSNFDGKFGTLAHAFSPENGHFHYDADESWSVNPQGDTEADLESVAVHEIGHLLGLGHSLDQSAIMFSEISYGAIKRDLQPDDIQGIQALYSYKWSMALVMGLPMWLPNMLEYVYCPWHKLELYLGNKSPMVLLKFGETTKGVEHGLKGNTQSKKLMNAYCDHYSVEMASIAFVELLEITEAIKLKDGEAETYISEIETIGQAYEDMQTQNQHLLQQVAERDDYNIKLVSESVKTKQGQSFLLSEKQALAKQLQQVNTSLGSLRLRIAHNEEQLKVYITEALKSTQEDRRLAVNLETVKWELADAEKELKWLKSAVSSSEKEYEQIQRKMDEIQNELDNERCFPVTIFSTL